MKRTLVYLLVIISIGTVITGYWVYKTFLAKSETERITSTVTAGDIQETLRARGEVVSSKDFELEFASTGKVSNVYAKKGASIKKDAPLMKLDTTELSLEKERLSSVLLQYETNLSKLQAGATQSDLALARSRVDQARVSLSNAKTNLASAIDDAKILGDNTVRNLFDQLLLNARTSPELAFQASDTQTKIDVENSRTNVESILKVWKSSTQTDPKSDIESVAQNVLQGLLRIDDLGTKESYALNGVSASANLTDNTINTWRTAISTGRTAVRTTVAALTLRLEAVRDASSQVTVATKELDIILAGTREEEIKIADALISEAKDEIAIVDEKIARMTLRAPSNAIVTDVLLSVGELAMPGRVALSLAVPEQKIQSDISELDISKVRTDIAENVRIEFDAYPSEVFTGSVISVEPKEVLKDGDKYFRANILFNATSSKLIEIRTGMSSDLVIRGYTKKNVLKIPEVAVYKIAGRRFVKILQDGIEQEVPVTVGVSDGDSIEIVSGLHEGQIVLIP